MIRCLHFSHFLTADSDFLFRFLLFSPTRSLLLLQLILRRWHPYYHTTATFWSHFFFPDTRFPHLCCQTTYFVITPVFYLYCSVTFKCTYLHCSLL